MAKILPPLCQLLLFTASMYGWGRLIGKWSYRCDLTGWAFPATLGIAVSIAMGGLLNALRLARPSVLIAILIAGLSLTLFFVYASFRDKKPRASKATSLSHPVSAISVGLNVTGKILFYGLVLSVLVFLVSALMPPRSFNYHDDFHIYLMWPVRMLQTGTLGNNPFSHIGLSSLGSQSFMQGMFLTFGTIADLNAFDAILCLILSLGLIKELGDRIGVNIVFINAACLLALFINPHYVNISSLYSASLMLLGLAYATLLLTQCIGSSKSSGTIPAALMCSLFYAALLSLKTTYVFVAPLFWAAGLVGLLFLVREKRQVLRAHVFSGVFSIIFLIPWLCIHLGRYIQKIHYILNNISYPKERSFSTSLINKGDVLSQLLSNEQLLYGNTYRDYLALVVMLFLALLAAGFIAWRTRGRRETSMLIPLLAVPFSVIANYLLYYGATFFAAWLVVRYSCPLLISAAPVAVLLAGWLWAKGYKDRLAKMPGYGVPIILGSLLLIFQIAIAGMFRETFVERVKRADHYGTLLSFPLALDPLYIDYNKYVLSDEAQRRMSGLQNLVPAGDSILAWVSMPMYLDYGRNTIYPTYEYGISNRLLVMPFTAGPEGMRQFFHQLGIRYFIWEYKGFGMKTQTNFGGLQRNFIKSLTDLLPESRVLYNDGGTIVFDIGPGN